MLTLNFTPATGEGAVTTIKAGTPYIIRWNNTSGSLTDPFFTSKTIVMNLSNVVCDLENGRSISFCGTYANTTYNEEDRSILFLGGSNNLYFPQPGLQYPNQPYGASTNPYVTFPAIGAQRAYFQLVGLTAGTPDGSRGVRIFNLNFGDDAEETAIRSLSTEEQGNGASAWYDLSGRKIEKGGNLNRMLRKGLYIHEGRKVVIH
jgi:hypothetical protein